MAKKKHHTLGHIKNDNVHPAPRHDECGEREGTDAYKGYWDLPYPRARVGVEGKPYIHDVFNPPDGDTPDEN